MDNETLLGTLNGKQLKWIARALKPVLKDRNREAQKKLRRDDRTVEVFRNLNQLSFRTGSGSLSVQIDCRWFPFSRDREQVFVDGERLLQEAGAADPREEIAFYRQEERLALDGLTRIHLPGVNVKKDILPLGSHCLEGHTVLSVDGTGWKSALQRCLISISQEKSRYELGVVRIAVERETVPPDRIKNFSLRLIATDGRRMSVAEMHESGLIHFHPPEGQKRLEISLKSEAARLVESLITDQTLVTVEATTTHARLSFEENRIKTVLTVRLAADSFPDWKRIFPNVEQDYRPVQVERKALQSALKRMTRVINPKDGKVLVSVEPDRMSLESQSEEWGGMASCRLPAQGDVTCQIRFNSHYLLDFLNHIQDEKINLLVKNSKATAVMQPVSNGYQYAVMPMRPPEEALTL